MSMDDMQTKGYVNIKFIVFLKATLGKMMGTNILPQNFLDLHFWQSWPQKFYNIKSYDSIKEELKKMRTSSKELGSPASTSPQLIPDDGNDQLSPSIISNEVNINY